MTLAEFKARITDEILRGLEARAGCSAVEDGMISEAAIAAAKKAQERAEEKYFAFAHRVCPRCGGQVASPWWATSAYSQMLRCKPCKLEWHRSVFD